MLVVFPKSIPPVNVGSASTLIVVPDESLKTLIACPSSPLPVVWSPAIVPELVMVTLLKASSSAPST